MKIGILTFHNSLNYGAVLQAYGLVRTLEKLGHDVEVINYKCNKIEEDLKSAFSKNVFKKLYFNKKRLEFYFFNKQYLHINKEVTNLNNIINKYDIIIVGSDQIWNSLITNDDKAYYLPNLNRKKIAYGASCGDYLNINENYFKYIKRFDAVSVREDMLKQHLKEKNIESEKVYDPVIVAGKPEYDKFSIKKPLRRKYVYLYMIAKSKKLYNIAKTYAEKNEYVLISNKHSPINFLFSNPKCFVSWIANAEYVFTNSFHGTVFSILFHKKFMSSIYKNNGITNTRIKELMLNLNIKNNIIMEDKNIEQIPDINYNDIDTIIEEMKCQSLQFLKKSLTKYEK